MKARDIELNLYVFVFRFYSILAAQFRRVFAALQNHFEQSRNKHVFLRPFSIDELFIVLLTIEKASAASEKR